MSQLPEFLSVRLQKYILNCVFITSVVFLEIRVYLIIEDYRPDPLFLPGSPTVLHPDGYMALAIILLLGWLGVMLAYYAWAIYHYNINQGLTNEEWKKINDRKKEKETKLQLELITEVEADQPDPVNPYKEETFGLPPGTVRGTIALSLLVACFALLILSKDPDFLKNPEFIERYFEFIKTAIIMMIAFYFGNQSLKYLRSPVAPPLSTGNPPQPVVPEGRTSAKPVPTTLQTAPPIPELDNTESQLMATSPAVPVQLTSLVTGTVVEREEVHSSPALTLAEINEIALNHGLEAAHIKAVLQVESRGKGFLEDGRPVILFEGHKFYQFLKAIKPDQEFKDLVKANPEILYEKWTKAFYKGGSKEYNRYDTAFAIHADSAMLATSWGLFQIMGFNYKSAGFNSVHDFVDAQKESEKKQLEAFTHFLEVSKLLKPLQEEDWRKFAEGYNGKRYEENRYHLKLAEAYMHFLQKDKPGIVAVLTRQSMLEKETLGELRISNGIQEIFKCKTLELPWRNNQHQVSCIPAGVYKVTRHTSPRHGDVFLVNDVPNRSNILIHAGNYFGDTLGCILVGKDIIDLNKDKLPDITNSKNTLALLRNAAPNGFLLTVKEAGTAPESSGLIT